MARLQRVWGVQHRHVLTGEWLDPLWMRSRANALHSLSITEESGTQARLVSQVQGPVQVEPRYKVTEP